jgi:hypothetical protein
MEVKWLHELFCARIRVRLAQRGLITNQSITEAR